MNTNLFPIQNVPFVGLQQSDIYKYKQKETEEDVSSGINQIRLKSLSEIIQLESEVYDDILSCTKGADRMRMYIMASLCSAWKTKKPSMSYEFRNHNCVLDGYFISLVGDANFTISKKYVLLLKNTSGNTKCVYVCDWCTRPHIKNKPGSFLIKQFFTDYARSFIAHDNMLPIISEQRVSTSFPIIKNGLNVITKIINRELSRMECKFKIVIHRHVSPKFIKGDAQHTVILIPKLKI